MAIKKRIFDYEKVKKKLLNEGKYGLTMLSIIDFLKTEPLKEIIDDMNSQFNSKYGNKAYSREILIGIMLYCFKYNAFNYSDIARMVECDKIIDIFTGGFKPKRSTIKRFLNNTPRILFKKIFLSTLLLANEYKFLKFLNLFIDSTDGLVRANRNNIITLKEVKAMKLLNKWNLGHNGKYKSIKQFKNKLVEKATKFDKSSKTYSLLAFMYYNPKKFYYDNLKRVNEFEDAINKSNKDFIAFNFKEALLIKTKKGNFDFGFNIQTAMSEQTLVISSLASKQVNDHTAAEEIVSDLKENFTILLEMVKKYGTHKNYQEIENLIKKAIYVFDSGYSSNKNIETLEKEKLNALIMTKQISKQINNELRRKNGAKIKTGKLKNKKKISKINFKRIKNGYKCPIGKILKLTKVKPIKTYYDKFLKENNYIYQCKYCPKCKYRKICAKDEKYKTITDKTTPELHNMTEKILDGRYSKIYAKRFYKAEGINGYYKNTKGIMHLLGSNPTSIQNGLDLVNTMYNITRICNLKDTAY